MFDDLIKRGRRKPLFVRSETTQSVQLDSDQVKRMLPHRDPFLFVDSIVAVDFEQRAIEARRVVDADDPVFAGHFPGAPVYPGVLQVEAVGQAGISLAHLLRKGNATIDEHDQPGQIRLLKVHHAQFQGAVEPGATLRLFSRCVHDSDFVATYAGQILNAQDDSIVAFTIFDIYLLDAE